MKPTYIRVKYNSQIGYELVITNGDRTIRAIFFSIEDAKEYLIFKVGKILAKKFDYNFNEIKNVFIEIGFDYTKVIDIPAFIWREGDSHTTVGN